MSTQELRECFHLAIPAQNLTASVLFYRRIGAYEVRGAGTAHSAVLRLWGHQLVLHRSEDILTEAELTMYPRHFGLLCGTRGRWNRMLAKCRKMGPLWTGPCIRYEGMRREHRTFFVRDPSNNLIEFKWYRTVAM